MNAFTTLGLKPGARACEIKRAYKSLALLHHPDKPSGDQKRFQGISAAFAECMKRAEEQPQNVTADAFVDACVNASVGVTFIRITIREMVQGGTRPVCIPPAREKCKACLGTGARDPADFITCLGCAGTGHSTLGDICLSCGGVGGCNVSVHRARCPVCDGQRFMLSKRAARVNVTIPPGVLDGAALDCSKFHLKVSHQDLCTPVALEGQPGCSVSMSRLGESNDLSLTVIVTITLGEMMCGFHRRIMLYGQLIELHQKVYNPAIAEPLHVFKTLRSMCGLDVFVHIVVAYPACSEVAPFRQMLDRMFS